MRAAAIAGAVFAAFIGVMYLRFAGDSVPPAQPPASPGAEVRGPCVVAQPADAPGAAPTPAGDRAPCATMSPFDPRSRVEEIVVRTPEPQPPPLLRGRPIYELEFGSEMNVPPGVALIVETGCTQCDGPTTGLSRVYLNTQGEAVVEQLFTPDKVGMLPQVVQTEKGPQQVEPSVTGFATAGDGSDMAVSVCSVGYYCHPGSTEASAEHRIFRSVDGGVTWADFGTLAFGTTLLGFVDSGRFLVVSYPPPATSSVSPTAPEPAYFLYPSLTPIEPPPTAHGPVWPFISPDGGIVWETAGGLLVRQDGTPFLTNEPRGAHFQREIFRDPDYYLVAFATDQSTTYISLMTPRGEPEVNFSIDGYLRLGGMLSRSQVFANATVTDLIHRELPSPFVGWLPAVIDLEAGTVHPIAGPFLDPPLMNGRNQIIAVQQGPFARVVNTEDTCLNIRAEPSGGQIIECVSEGVLLRHSGELEFLDSGTPPTWLKVTTPAGVQGWAALAYLDAYGTP
jgi:hypothetical protein